MTKNMTKKEAKKWVKKTSKKGYICEVKKGQKKHQK